MKIVVGLTLDLINTINLLYHCTTNIASPIDQQLLRNEIKESPDKMEAEEHWDDIGIQLQIIDEMLEDIGSNRLSYEGSFQRNQGMGRGS